MIQLWPNVAYRLVDSKVYLLERLVGPEGLTPLISCPTIMRSRPFMDRYILLM